MTYAAVALARTDGDWTADDIDLNEVEDLDGVVELVRAIAGDEADPTLLFVEEDDEWFAILRLNADDDMRVFMSDARVVASSDIAALFGEAAIETDLGDDDDDDPETAGDESDDEDEGAVVDGEPAGDTGLLSDLGTSGPRLLSLCAAEGQLPADVISALCESAGCLDVLEKLRGG